MAPAPSSSSAAIDEPLRQPVPPYRRLTLTGPSGTAGCFSLSLSLSLRSVSHLLPLLPPLAGGEGGAEEVNGGRFSGRGGGDQHRRWYSGRGRRRGWLSLNWGILSWSAMASASSDGALQCCLWSSLFLSR